MKKILLALLMLVFTTSLAYAGYVRGYTRSDGTVVQGYYRSDANNTVRDNYSYEGNTNPYTGVEGHNHYRNNPTSEYYGTSNNSGLNTNNSFNSKHSLFDLND